MKKYEGKTRILLAPQNSFIFQIMNELFSSTGNPLVFLKALLRVKVGRESHVNKTKRRMRHEAPPSYLSLLLKINHY